MYVLDEFKKSTPLLTPLKSSYWVIKKSLTIHNLWTLMHFDRIHKHLYHGVNKEFFFGVMIINGGEMHTSLNPDILHRPKDPDTWVTVSTLIFSPQFVVYIIRKDISFVLYTNLFPYCITFLKEPFSYFVYWHSDIEENYIVRVISQKGCYTHLTHHRLRLLTLRVQRGSR